MAPIRTAIIGLSSSAITSWAAAAHIPYLLSPRGREKYTIVALLNSSVDAAKKSIVHYKLSPETKAYGDPQALADDPDIDLVVSCTRVDKHHQTTLPSVKAGKSVFVEWPLAQDVKHAAELTEAAKASGSKTIVGIQGRLTPPVVRLREIVKQGRIGKILNSEIRAAGGTMDREMLMTGLEYFADRSIGGNMYTIGFGHLYDQVQYVLGDVIHPKPHFQLQRPVIKLKDLQTQEIVGTVKSNVPDLVIVAGTLSQSDITQKNASFLFRFRRGQPFAGEPDLVWTINGEKGEIRLVAPSGAALHANASTDDLTIEIHDYETDKVESVEWSFEDWQTELPLFARNTGKVYDVYAAGEGPVPTFGDALVRHEQLEGMLSGWTSD